MKRLFLSVLIVLLAAISLFAESKWTKVEMTDFTLVGTASEKELIQHGSNLEEFRQTLSQIFSTLKLESSTPTIIHVFDSKSELQSYCNPARFPFLPAGFFFSTPEANYITFYPDQNENYHTYLHEYFHYVLGNNMTRVPIWVNEGMAEYYATFTIDDSGTKVKLGTPAMRRLQEIKSKDLIPLERLFGVRRGSPEFNENDKVGTFYAESWALVHFLLNGNKGQRRRQFYNFIDLTNQGMAPKAAFAQAFQTDYQKLEDELRDYLNKFAFPVETLTLNKQVEWGNTAKVSKLSDAEAKTIQGNLLRYTFSNEEAEKRLQEAVVLDPNSPDAHRILGNIYEAQKKLPEARKSFEKALSADPNNYLNYYYLARYLREDKNYDEAIRYYQQAIKLKPDVPRVYVSLGSLYEYLSRNNEAIETYTKALRLNTASDANYFNLAKIGFKIGNTDIAAASATVIIGMNGWSNNYSSKSVLILYFIYQKENKTEDAAKILKLGLDNVNQKNFYYTVLRYLNKEMDEKELLSAAKDSNDKTIAATYIGLNLLAGGKSAEAKEQFDWVANNGNHDFTEFDYAGNELKKMK